jgi:hypothetical protein
MARTLARDTARRQRRAAKQRRRREQLTEVREQLTEAQRVNVWVERGYGRRL